MSASLGCGRSTRSGCRSPRTRWQYFRARCAHLLLCALRSLSCSRALPGREEAHRRGSLLSPREPGAGRQEDLGGGAAAAEVARAERRGHEGRLRHVLHPQEAVPRAEEGDGTPRTGGAGQGSRHRTTSCRCVGRCDRRARRVSAHRPHRRSAECCEAEGDTHSVDLRRRSACLVGDAEAQSGPAGAASAARDAAAKARRWSRTASGACAANGHLSVLTRAG